MKKKAAATRDPVWLDDGVLHALQRIWDNHPGEIQRSNR
jgi:hypothetical protein